MKKLAIMTSLLALVPAVSMAAYVSVNNKVLSPQSENGGGNIYLVGETVNVVNPVNGDILAAGSNVIVSSVVQKDVTAFGGTVGVVGAVAEDVRAAGGTLTIGGKFGGELMAAGGRVDIIDGTNIAKDSYIVGGKISFSGVENGTLNVWGGEVRIDGIINGDLNVRAASVTIGSRAVIKGTFEYTARSEAAVESGASLAGRTVFHKADVSYGRAAGNAFIGFAILWSLGKFLATLAIAYLLWHFRRKDMLSVLEGVHGRFWNNFLAGLSFFILVPVAAAIIFVTVVGMIPAIIGMLVYGVAAIIAGSVAVIIAASLVMRFLKRNEKELPWQYMLLGALFLNFISAIPVIGWAAGAVVYLLALGGTVNILKAKFA